ncbi:MAG: superoxide dismutase [Fibrobacteres bacterium]|nr:superoxide dismutase [Fibrobacterota bacterium]
MKSFKGRFKAIAIAAPIAAVFGVGCWDDNSTNGTTQFQRDQATATVRAYADSDSTIRGTVTFTDQGDSLRIVAAISGLTPGKNYAIHVHQFGNCAAPESSGEHLGFPVEPHGNPFDSLGKHHRGDIPNLTVDANGTGRVDFMTNAMSLNDTGAATGTGQDSIRGSTTVLGRSVVVHRNPDDYVTQPAGGSDGRIACGVIGLVNGGAIDTVKNRNDTLKNPNDTLRNPNDTIAKPRGPTY